jgi:hypothetical protein
MTNLILCETAQRATYRAGRTCNAAISSASNGFARNRLLVVVLGTASAVAVVEPDAACTLRVCESDKADATTSLDSGGGTAGRVAAAAPSVDDVTLIFGNDDDSNYT